MSLSIPNGLLERIRTHGRERYPHECCGLMLGKFGDGAKSVLDLVPVDNARDDSPHNRYLIAPSDLLRTEREARSRGLDIVGVYHSHPDHPARPSEFDREHALPWYSYVILSVDAGEPRDVTSWLLRDDRTQFDTENLVTL